MGLKAKIVANKINSCKSALDAQQIVLVYLNNKLKTGILVECENEQRIYSKFTTLEKNLHNFRNDAFLVYNMFVKNPQTLYKLDKDSMRFVYTINKETSNDKLDTNMHKFFYDLLFTDKDVTFNKKNLKNWKNIIANRLLCNKDKFCYFYQEYKHRIREDIELKKQQSVN